MNPLAVGLLCGAAGVAGGAYLGRSRKFSDLALMASPTPRHEGLVDTHHHMLPPFYLEAVGDKAIRSVTPADDVPRWSPQDDLVVMDDFKVRKAVLSAPLGTPGPTPQARADLARRLNEFGAGLVQADPKRYAIFATVPLPDIDASLKEAAFTLDTLKAPGLIVFTNYAGVYLGDPAFDPFWKEMNRRKAVIFVHPISPAHLETDIPAGILEFVFDTTRTVASLLYGGVTIKYPDIKFIFSHGGGALPYVSSRIEGPTRANAKLRALLPNGVKGELRKLYWDTALCFDATQIDSLLALTDPSKLMFGSDFPFTPKLIFPLSLKSLGAQLQPEQTNQIFSGSALRLMPSLAT